MARLSADKLNALKTAFIEDYIKQAGQIGVRPVWLPVGWGMVGKIRNA
jgi:hypothetical protein